MQRGFARAYRRAPVCRRMHATASAPAASPLDMRFVLLGLTGFAPPSIALAFAGSAAAPLVAIVAWTVLAAAVWVPYVLRHAPSRTLASTTVVGVVAGVCAGIVDASYDMMFVTGSVATSAQLFAFALALGLVWGALFGGIAWLIARRRGASARAAQE